MPSSRRILALLIAGVGIALVAACGPAGTVRALATPTGSTRASGTAPPAPSASATTPAAGASASATPPALGLTWSQLGKITPLSIEANRARLASDPQHPDVVAVCAAGAVRVSRDGGSPGSLQPVGSRLIWLQRPAQDGTPVLKSVALSSVHC